MVEFLVLVPARLAKINVGGRPSSNALGGKSIRAALQSLNQPWLASTVLAELDDDTYAVGRKIEGAMATRS